MLRKRLWGFMGRFGKRRGSAMSLLCVIALFLFLLVILFWEAFENSVVSLGRSKTKSGLLLGSPLHSPQRQPDEYLLMPSPLVCQRAKPFLIIMVTTAPANLEARQAIRDTWGGETEVRGRRVMTLFMVGQTHDPGISKQLVEEAQGHRDLIQGVFLDTYANLTLKTMSMLGWTCRFCPQARLIAKVDDDVLFNSGALLRYLNKSQSVEGDLYLGRIHQRVVPNRNPTNKHYLPATLYGPEVLPDYCSGTAYVLSHSAAHKIAKTAVSSPLHVHLPPEDVFVGLSALAVGIFPTHCPLFSGGPLVPYSRCCYQAMVSVHHVSPREMIRFWGEVHTTPTCSWLGLRTSFGFCKVGALLGTLLGRENSV